MGWVQGHVDEARFTRLGKREIRSAADLLAGEQVVAVYSSDLLRARRTALVIAGRLNCDLRIDPRLRERKFGMAEGVPWTEVPAAATGVSDERVVDEMARPPGGGESLRDVYLRCLHFLHDLVRRSDEGDVVVVGHDGSIRILKAIMGAHRVAGLTWESSPQDKVQPVALGRSLQLDAAS
jgi:2,3-bisphosphoglycerate-dependent phosphoglycerate mutase